MKSYPFDQRYEVKSSKGEELYIDSDEYIRQVSSAKPVYRIDGEEVYTAGANTVLIGTLDGNKVTDKSGDVVLTILDL